MNDFEYLSKVYAGFLGMNIGIRLGAPVEPTLWTSERIARFYGEISGYVKDFKNFAADDDVNGPVYFLRALEDGGFEDGLEARHVADAWLNYARDGMGMFWWGGYGTSTEHTAYENLKRGIEAPRSGSIKTNGKTIAEQIGGQIFIDTWGLIRPGSAPEAARLARTAASVSHDGEGLNGAAFIAACIAEAFETSDREKIIDAGSAQIPADSAYARMIAAVREFFKTHPGSWRACLAYLQDQWGYDRYPGVCHIIPNAGICVMALLYSRNFAEGIEIAAMAGWDTDCNAGNVGTILGTAHGIEGIPAHYRGPVNDGVVLSGISGSLNILDIPSYAKILAAASCRLDKKPVPALFASKAGAIDFDFLLPGSTHNFRVSDPAALRLRHVRARDRRTDQAAAAGTPPAGSLEVLFDRMVRGQSARIFYKPFYRRDDFDDERYMPVFSPTVYPGQECTISFSLERLSGESVMISPYVRNTRTKECIAFGGAVYRDEGTHQIRFAIPPDDQRIAGDMIDEIGLIFEGNSPEKNKDLGCLSLDRFKVEGKARYTIAMEKQCKEFASITPFSHNHGAWELARHESGVVYMEAMAAEHAEAMTGNYYMEDATLHGTMLPHNGFSHLAGLRIQGALRGYYAGFHGEGKAVIMKRRKTLTELASVSFPWRHETCYHIDFSARGSALTLKIDGRPLLECEDPEFRYGMAGYALYGMGRCGFGDLSIEEH
jgi:ADP-ribosylglycohydrolase